MSDPHAWPRDSQPMVPRSVVLASADAVLRQRLNQGLTGMRWAVREAVGGADAMAQVDASRPEALLVDSWLPDLEVGEFSAQMAALYPGMDVLPLDGSAAREGGVKSPRRNELLHALRLAHGDAPLIYPTSSARKTTPSPINVTPPLPRAKDSASEMIGESSAMQELNRLIHLVAPRDTTVLIEGETGTGKELVAKALHRLGARSGKPFTVLNCAAIPESLLEAELFGHTRGAFTGAVQSRTGRIEAAHGGTLFLDEIGEMPIALQAKMLRFLEGGELQKVGDNDVIRVDVRVIAATHQDLQRRADDGTFRLDLYHRLAVFPLEVPPLRERLDDLLLLTNAFLGRMASEGSRKTISDAAMQLLVNYTWPGNVRELKHVLERANILAEESREISFSDIRLRTRRTVAK